MNSQGLRTIESSSNGQGINKDGHIVAPEKISLSDNDFGKY